MKRAARIIQRQCEAQSRSMLLEGRPDPRTNFAYVRFNNRIAGPADELDIFDELNLIANGYRKVQA